MELGEVEEKESFAVASGLKWNQNYDQALLIPLKTFPSRVGLLKVIY